ncbi:MAG: hypothetical protein JXB85_14605 [Anaerolineales bacterium]|nr:hypothetical protein [Anaerolineales bacterium]
MIQPVDSFRFLGGITRRMAETWIKQEQPRPIPWRPLRKPLAECTVALLSSGGVALKDDRPFNQDGERRNPWWGDPSYRLLPNTVKTEDVRVYHLHINPAFGEQDLNCLLPVDRLNEMVLAGEVGRAALRHYSTMGYILEPEELLEKTVPQIVQNLRQDRVEVLVLVPS